MQPLLRVNALTKRYNPATPAVVDDVSFDVGENEIFAVLGPSGCGKTTTLRLIAGFERADQGSVELRRRVVECAHEHIPPDRRGIGFVFQEYALFPHLSVTDNIGFGLSKLPKSEREARIRRMEELAGLSGLGARKPHELSGGQQQRVALARALAPMPDIILLDEPFSNLDAVLRQSTRQEIRAMLKNAGMSAILVTHDQEEALSFADRIAVMNHGRIEQIGTPEDVYETPRTEFVARFLGRTNLFPALASGMEAQSPMGPILIDRPATGDVTLSVRPEHLSLERVVTQEVGFCGTVTHREFKGHDITYIVRLDDFECLVHTDNRSQFLPGDRVAVRLVEPAVVLNE
jgi:iron(III) transport system ATP-binding protein